MMVLREPNLERKTRERRNDILLCATARRLLKASGYLSLSALECSFTDGVITVSGAVSSYFLKQMAQEIVLKVSGVQAVDNQVEVR
jgi:osmotically-inducible protein OsmY